MYLRSEQVKKICGNSTCEHNEQRISAEREKSTTNEGVLNVTNFYRLPDLVVTCLELKNPKLDERETKSGLSYPPVLMIGADMNRDLCA